jgi:hypothetical protein
MSLLVKLKSYIVYLGHSRKTSEICIYRFDLYENVMHLLSDGVLHNAILEQILGRICLIYFRCYSLYIKANRNCKLIIINYSYPC